MIKKDKELTFIFYKELQLNKTPKREWEKDMHSQFTDEIPKFNHNQANAIKIMDITYHTQEDEGKIEWKLAARADDVVRRWEILCPAAGRVNWDSHSVNPPGSCPRTNDHPPG